MKLNTIGADIEEFVCNSSGEIVSIINKLQADKDNPCWLTHGNIQEDNVLAEYAINVSTSKQEFRDNIKGLRQELEHIISELEEPLVLVPIATHQYTREFLQAEGTQALRFGCDAEFCAWSEGLNMFSKNNFFTTCQGRSPDLVEEMKLQYKEMPPSPYTELRTAGGHVHFGYDNPNDYQTINIVKVMDYTLGVWSVINDTDTRRRDMYGKAGALRIKSYGGEYRALSNFWVQSDTMINQVYDLTSLAVSNHDKVELLSTVCTPSELQRIINEYDKAAAQRVFTEALALLTRS
jgi:hypothetical protein